MRMRQSGSLASIVVGALIMAGCADPPAPESRGSNSPDAHNAHPEGRGHDHSEHAHPEVGPHGGDLIELGNEEYHVELIHPPVHSGAGHSHEGATTDHPAEHSHDGASDHGDGENDSVTAWILDASAQKVVAIDAAEIAINLSHNGQPEQFKLAALPAETDATGQSSRFVSVDKELIEHFHEAEVEGTLVLTIGGKSYRGQIVHEHAGHAH